ncbi:MAG: hypothetical protein JNJ45_10385 [Chthonomonas sp.]|nr:hypothetical protein [Chthonomonas sp.]
MSAKKKLTEPKWWKNTFFWIAGILVIIGIIGLPFLGGDRAIRDPGQLPEGNLALLYWLAAVIMFVNGWLSHKNTVMEFQDLKDIE